MRFLFALVFFINTSYATPPIDGGRDEPLTSFDYADVVKLDNGIHGSCSGTFVKQNLILTAAHCVLRPNGRDFIQTVKIGTSLGIAGTVVNIFYHPEYKQNEFAYNNAKDPKEKKRLGLKRTLFDIAFIETEKRETKRTLPYPKIIDENTVFSNRNNVELAGYGATKLTWSGSQWIFNGEKSAMQIATNEWVSCPQNYFGVDIQTIESLVTDVNKAMRIQAKRVHEISEGKETIHYDEKGMILAGDSGSPSLERDKNGNLIITGVASNMTPFDEGSGNAKLEIYQNGTLIESVDIKDFPKNWAQASKEDLAYPEITTILAERGFLENGKIKEDIKLKRIFTRVNQGYFADLSYPSNQDFIKGVFEKTP